MTPTSGRPVQCRRRVGLGLCLALLLSAGAVACSRHEAHSPGRVSAGTVTVPNLSFVPAILSVRPGTTVTWRFLDGRSTHNVNIDSGAASGDRSYGDSFSHVFREKGNYRYDCSLHPTMQGLIRVSEVAPARGDAAFPIEDDAPVFSAALLDQADMPVGFTELATAVAQPSEGLCPDRYRVPLPAPRIERKIAFRRGPDAAVQEVALHSAAGGRRYVSQLWARVRDCPGWTATSPGLGEIRLTAPRRARQGPVRTVTFGLSYSARGQPLEATTVVAQTRGVVSTLTFYGQLTAAERQKVIRGLSKRLIEAVAAAPSGLTGPGSLVDRRSV